MSEPLWAWSATRLASAIKSREVSSAEAVQSCLDRISEVNPYLNAVVSVQSEPALDAARLADEAVASGAVTGPLHGVPITTKINVDQAGLPTTNGVTAFADNIAVGDNPVVANLKRAGAVILGRTNTPAFSMRWYTDNDLHGRTLNPWRPDVTPGGSSGGAAVAVATGMCAIGHGNDGGGSIRYPAYCTGTVGLRPSFGRIPTFNPSALGERQLSLQFISVQGAITRSVEDAWLALCAMAAPDPRDPWFVPVPLQKPQYKPCKVAVCFDPAAVGISSAVQDTLRAAADILVRAGYEVTERNPPNVLEAARDWNDFAQGEARHSIYPLIEQYGDALSRRAFALMLNRTPILDVPSLMRLSAARATYIRRWQLFMESSPLILCPVAMEQALPYGVDTDNDTSVDRLYRSHVFLFATAFLGLPSISVPTGVHDGIPVGVQIIAPRFREDMVVAAASAIEAACGRFTPMEPKSIAP